MMTARINLPLMGLLSITALAGGLWYTGLLNESGLLAWDMGITPTSTIDRQIDLNNNGSSPTSLTLAPTVPLKQPTPKPTVSRTARETTPGQTSTSGDGDATITSSPQNISVTRDFLDDIYFCNEGSIGSVNTILDEAANKLKPYTAEHDTCTADAETKSQACFSACSSPFNTNCNESCGTQTDADIKACNDTYASQKAPIITDTTAKLAAYCPYKTVK